ncbi:unnamed protein product, partial [Allacma fusca]
MEEHICIDLETDSNYSSSNSNVFVNLEIIKTETNDIFSAQNQNAESEDDEDYSP